MWKTRAAHGQESNFHSACTRQDILACLCEWRRLGGKAEAEAFTVRGQAVVQTNHATCRMQVVLIILVVSWVSDFKIVSVFSMRGDFPAIFERILYNKPGCIHRKQRSAGFSFFCQCVNNKTTVDKWLYCVVCLRTWQAIHCIDDELPRVKSL